ncbi:MAG: chemotaxis protein CheX [Leptolinea sp.]|jgi:chemotaxis protein CheX|nr:chemotaxis protein CheX [Leptolinea sp.]
MANVKFMNPFVEAAAEVLEKEVGAKVQRGSLSLQKSALTSDEITVLLSLVGQVQGVVLYGLSIDTSLKMVSKMMGQEFSEFDNLAQSGIAELGNVITGRATVKLSKEGFDSEISPPTLVQGQGLQISTLDFPRVVVELKTEMGNIIVHLALRETPPGSEAGKNYVPIAIPMK